MANLEKDLLAATDLRTDESKENLKDGGAMAAMREITWKSLMNIGVYLTITVIETKDLK